MTLKRFKIYNKETLDTYIEDTQDCYSNGNTKTYWFGDNEDFCDLFKKLNELAEENEELKQFKQNVFGLIDKNLEKDKHVYEMTYEDYLNGRIEVLEELKKELEE